MNECQTCKKETKNPKFCSKSCSAKSTNKSSPKRSLTNRCKTCDELISKTRSYCSGCWSDYRSRFKVGSQTIAEYCNGYTTYEAHAKIRGLARDAFKRKSDAKACQKCGYDKHIEICHIRAISDFPNTATLDKVNHISNLVGLCRNCHWELDNGYLQVP